MYGFENCQFCGAHKGGGEAMSGKESNYEKLFGTPDRAAETLANFCQFTHGGELCDRCQCYLFGDCDRTLRLRSDRSIYDALLEWLKSEVME